MFVKHPDYPTLLSPWSIRGHELRNRVVFPPTCPTWVDNPWSGRFTDQAVAYYRERAAGGVGLVIIGATHVHPSSLAAPLAIGSIYDDRAIEPLARVAEAVHAEGAKLAIQLLHTGVRSALAFKQDTRFDPDAEWYSRAPSQIPLGETPGSLTPKAMDDAEIEEIITAFGTAAERAAAAGLDGVEFHLSHGYLPWQFLSPLYNHRDDAWGGDTERRLAFPVRCLDEIRQAVGQDRFVGYRINSTSFWPGDLETPDIVEVVRQLEARCDVDYVSVSAGVHHAFIHTPMHFEQGWERDLASPITEVSSKPVLMVGRITEPGVAERMLVEGHGDAVCLGRQLFADPDWVQKAVERRPQDIRRCVAANLCWKTAMQSRRVQCVYNPAMGREAAWGRGTLTRVADPKRVLVIGGGPAGLEYARVASARGHQVTVVEAAAEVGGHALLQSRLPTRQEYGRVGRWLGEQAAGNGADIRTGVRVDEDTLDGLFDELAPDHVVLSTGSRAVRDGFQGWTAKPVPGWETGRTAGWDEVAEGTVVPEGRVVVVDDQSDVIAPLTAVLLAQRGAEVALVTRWPMVGMETVLDVYLEWIYPQLYAAGVEMIPDHFITAIDGDRVTLSLIHDHSGQTTRQLAADWVVMATARRSQDALRAPLQQRGISFEVIGDAVAPRGTYEAVYEGHRQGRKL
ncbi:oxidoreductase [Amycolatopsis pithecellobii]|uniref:NAD(P)-binding protein n=1 Tax=Amycolatopsis pithecellobii TaxID=664692 RepID=A0A6N7Z9V1_9PSEU|nr:FAD-dependent oxidoreductase [Amycolatopsis pithecellobii]MTD58518.1 NAD(P)-binding protein [Amycolatopsis pithecellobii]